MYKTAVIILKEDDALTKVFDEQCHMAKLFKNSCIYRLRQLFFMWQKDYDEEQMSDSMKEVLQEFTDAGVQIHKKHSLPNYFEFDKMFKTTNNPDYYNELPSQCIQQIIKESLSDFKAFFKSLKAYKKCKTGFTGKPKIPHYCKSDKTSFDITNQDAVVYSRQMKKGDTEEAVYELKLPKTKHRLNLGRLEIQNLKEVTVKPFYNTYKVCIVYETEDTEVKELDETRVLGIDLGIDNFLAVSNNCGLVPFVINGKIMKSKNQFLNKQISRLQECLAMCQKKQYTSNRIQKLWKYRNNFFNDQVHKISTYIMNYCIENNIGTVIVGRNDGWKQGSNMGSRNNQKFCFIPHSQFIRKLKEKAVIAGIIVIEQEESYTSKASHLDMDEIPVYGKAERKPVFSGRRKYRGLYVSSDGTEINADVNGASNIIRKCIPDAFYAVTDFSYLTKSVDIVTI